MDTVQMLIIVFGFGFVSGFVVKYIIELQQKIVELKGGKKT